MAVEVIDKIKPKNNGKFPVAEAVDIKVSDNLRLDKALENKADLSSVNFALAGKANATDFATSTANLQGQINQIVISSSAESVVAPEVAAARVDVNGVSHATLKDRIDDTQKQLNDFVYVASKSNLENGIWTNSGTKEAAGTRLRNKDKVFLPVGSKIIIYPNGFKFYVSQYETESSSSVSNTGWIGGDNKEIAIDVVAPYIGFAIANSTDTSISPSDYNSTFYAIKDNSISKVEQRIDAFEVEEKNDILDVSNLTEPITGDVETEVYTSQAPADTTQPIYFPYIPNKDLSGNILTKLRLKGVSGQMSLSLIKINSTGELTKPLDEYSIFKLAQLTIQEGDQEFLFDGTDENVEMYKDSIYIPKGYYLMLGYPGETGKYKYNGTRETSGDSGFYAYNQTNNEWLGYARYLGVDISAYSSVGYVYKDQTLENDISECKKIKEEVDILTNVIGGDAKIISGYDDDNQTVSVPGNSPYAILKNFGTKKIAKIELNVYTTGTISVGYIKGTTLASLDYTDKTIAASFEVTTTGKTTLIVPTPFSIPTGYSFFICDRSDTVKFKYGSYGTDTGFAYYNNGVSWSHSNNSLGLNIYTSYEESIEYFKSTYRGKTISILGDSISTFAGYIPEGNATYYPSGSVQSVTDTWWNKLYTALEMTLNVNNSWSGSRVTTTAGEESAGCMTRCQNLGENPDVIIVYMGINDFNNEVALGTYDGESPVPEMSTTTFREAYGIMLDKILTAYPTSEVWCCTLPQCERNAAEVFPEINGNGVPLNQFNKAIEELAFAFGVNVLYHHKCGLTYQNFAVYNTDKLHPNKQGHSLMANSDIRQMDPYVRKRY